MDSHSISVESMLHMTLCDLQAHKCAFYAAVFATPVVVRDTVLRRSITQRGYQTLNGLLLAAFSTNVKV